MSETKKLKFIIINITIFIAIFSIFGFITYNFVRSNQYSRIDRELSSTAKLYYNVLNNNYGTLPPANPRVIAIIRDESGTVVEESRISDYYRSYEKELRPSKLNFIYSINQRSFSFRTLAFPVNADQKKLVVQLLVNTNAERDMLDNLLEILVSGGVGILFISIGASWYLSGKSIKPIVESWQRQRQFVENASHELRTPLTVIQSRLELLLSEPNAKIMDKYEFIGQSLSETRRVSKMVSDLLTLARSDSDTIEIEKTNVNIRNLLFEISEPYIAWGEAQGKKVSVQSEDIELFCDRERIHQLIVILLDNAIKYTELDGKIFVRAFIKENKCIINIEDNGIGIRKENLYRIFERFYREDTARSRETGGSGLGLSIAKWIVNKHNGSIEAHSNIPKGTVFTIKFPLTKKG